MAVALIVSVPVVVEFPVLEVPPFWSFVLSWLTSPFLYLVINFIIVVVAFSTLQYKFEEPPQTAGIRMPSAVPLEYTVPYDGIVSKSVVEPQPAFGYVFESNAVTEAKTEVKDLETNERDEFTISRSSWTSERRFCGKLDFGRETASSYDVRPLESRQIQS